MVDSIFIRLKPENSSAIRNAYTNVAPNQTIQTAEVDVEDLIAALSSVAGEIELAHSSFQKLYEEASYIYNRLDHMEKSYTSQQKKGAENKATKEDESGESGSGTSSVVVNKALFIGDQTSSLDAKLVKIQEAKKLTQNLLNAIESLSEKVKKANKVIADTPATPSNSRLEMK